MTSNLESEEEDLSQRRIILPNSPTPSSDDDHVESRKIAVVKRKKKLVPSISLPPPPVLSIPGFGLGLAEGSGTNWMDNSDWPGGNKSQLIVFCIEIYLTNWFRFYFRWISEASKGHHLVKT